MVLENQKNQVNIYIKVIFKMMYLKEKVKKYILMVEFMKVNFIMVKKKDKVYYLMLVVR